MGYWCNQCRAVITEEEYEYSNKKFNKALCRKHQKEFASETPKSTPEAKKLYFELKKRGIPAELEKWDGHKHIDIAIPSAKINVEVDGGQHNFKSEQALADLRRTYFSFKKGYFTLRIPNSLIRDNFEETVRLVCGVVRASQRKLNDDELENESLWDSIFGF